ncbi:restriction endonuclease subunit S [Avibacterium paragallinarum]|uniref:restriction endonuclease subunit S n=1 Tax=Avibacterium paragallinarum TaxID=728 RepID=UPI0021F77AD4|nr:restriction endonuclease subunit S [Avibacterium paragallinarum]UXN36779.1 restriction endonuclease subunit S [Avibacterium paragallinarum]
MYRKIEDISKNFDKFRKPLSSRERSKIQGEYPYYGAAKIIDYVDGFTHTGLSLLIAEDGSVETEEGFPVLQLANGKYWVNNHTHVLKGENDYETKYLYYALKQVKISPFITGAVQKKISQKALNSIEVRFLENASDRKKVVDTLDAFDQKITLNTQTNQTLEQIAQAIFKHWFIDFAPVHAKANALARGETIEQAELAAMACLSGKTVEKITALKTQDPTAYHQLQQTAAAFPGEFVETEMGEVPKGWEVTTLNHICEMKNGYAFKSKEWTDEGIPVIKIGSVKPMLIELDNGSFVAAENETLRADFLASEGDILVGLTGYVGEVGRIPYQEKAMINQRVAKFLPKKITETMDYYCFIYCLARQKEFKAFTEMNAKGSAQANISTREILSYPVIIATKEIHIAFENVVKNLLDKIIVNSGENSTLTKTRDGLLPKLLSGEIEL